MTQQTVEIRFTRREVIYATYTSQITLDELAQLKACDTRDDQLNVVEMLGADDPENHMVNQAESIESVEELTDLSDGAGNNLLAQPAIPNTNDHPADIPLPASVKAAFNEVRKYHPEVNLVIVTQDYRWYFLNSELLDGPVFSSAVDTNVLTEMVDSLHDMDTPLPVYYQLEKQ